MKHIKILSLFITAMLMMSCGDDIESDSASIFDTTSPERNEFDTWLLENYTKPYNIEFNYRYNDKETDHSYNVIPADYEKSVALAKMVKHVWLDAYTEAAGGVHKEIYVPRNAAHRLSRV